MLKEIIESKGWPQEVMDLANELHQMNAAYTAYAANFSHKLFNHQKTLGLDKDDMVQALTEIAVIIQVIEANCDKAIKIAVSNQPAPHLGNLPKEDAEV